MVELVVIGHIWHFFFEGLTYEHYFAILISKSKYTSGYKQI
jgi:hypothetical protein